MVPCVVESGTKAVSAECDVIAGGIRSNCGRTFLKVSTIVIYITDIAYCVVESGANVLANGTDPGMSCDHCSCAAKMTAGGSVGSSVYCGTIAP